jgi:hypothetical protein
VPFAYYDKLSPARQRIYRKSDAIETLGIPPGLALAGAIAAIADGLRNEHRASAQSACQNLVDALVKGYHVPAVRVKVLLRRPADDYGELHGLYEPEEEVRGRASRCGCEPRRRSKWSRSRLSCAR